MSNRKTVLIPPIVEAAIYGDADKIDGILSKALADNVDADFKPTEKYFEILNARHPRTGRTALIEAAARGFAHVVYTLLIDYDDGLDINATEDVWDYTALILASENGYAKIVRMLIEYGADVDLICGTILPTTAIKIATIKGHTEIVKMLKEASIDFSNDENEDDTF